MNRLLIFLAAVVLLGAGCITIKEPGETPPPTQPVEEIDVLDDGEVTTDELDQLLSNTCTETGGEWNEGESVCTCTEETTLDADSGECLTADGTPGGERGEEMRARYELMVACKETAGIYDDNTTECTCPDADTLNEDSGECQTADGLPDGIRGEEARQLTFETNCKDSNGAYSSEDSTCTCLYEAAGEDGSCPEEAPEEDATDTGTTS